MIATLPKTTYWELTPGVPTLVFCTASFTAAVTRYVPGGELLGTVTVAEYVPSVAVPLILVAVTCPTIVFEELIIAPMAPVTPMSSVALKVKVIGFAVSKVLFDSKPDPATTTGF